MVYQGYKFSISQSETAVKVSFEDPDSEGSLFLYLPLDYLERDIAYACQRLLSIANLAVLGDELEYVDYE
jgi:hypothetical protein